MKYLIGTHVQEKSGRVRVKVGKGEWVSRNRLNWTRHYKKELNDHMRVYHINGDKADDSPKNLVAITFSAVRYNLRHSKIIFKPKVRTLRRSYA